MKKREGGRDIFCTMDKNKWEPHSQANILRRLLPDIRGDDCSDIDQDVNYPNILVDFNGGGYDDCVCDGTNNDDDSNDNDIAFYIRQPQVC